MQIEARDHPMVQAALARLAAHGAWDRIGTAEPLDDRADRVDAELLVAAGVLTRTSDDTFAVQEDAFTFGAVDAQSVAQGTVVQLRRALRHAEGGALGWVDDPAVMRAQGLASAAVADLLRNRLLADMPSSRAALESGPARFLDVGTGIAAIAARLCELYPKATAVGLDVSEVVLDLARDHLAERDLLDQVELRLESVAELADVDAYDLAWLPQPFIPPEVFSAGVARVYDALRPDRWVVVPLATATADADPFTRALFVHTAHLMGGGPIAVGDALEVLAAAGYVEACPWTIGQQVIVRARKP